MPQKGVTLPQRPCPNLRSHRIALVKGPAIIWVQVLRLPWEVDFLPVFPPGSTPRDHPGRRAGPELDVTMGSKGNLNEFALNYLTYMFEEGRGREEA